MAQAQLLVQPGVEAGVQTEPRVSPADIPSLLRRAVGLHQAGQLGEAEKLYNQAIQAAPDNFDALHLYGVLKHQRGDSIEALKLIGKALRAKADAPAAHSNYGLVLAVLERDAEALESYDRAIALKPDYAEAVNNRGNALRKLNRNTEALESFERALRLRPGYPEALNNRGNALAALDRTAEALESYDEALAQRPSYVDALVNRAELLRRLERMDDAIASLDRAIALKPNHSAALKARARISYASGGLLDAALADYKRLIALMPGDADAPIERGNVYYQKRRYGDALADYERTVALRPDFAPAHNNRGNALRELGRFEEALEAFDKALTLMPEYADAHNNRGNVLIELNRPDEALVAYNRALELKPDFAFALVNRGNALRYLGHADEALDSFDCAIRQVPELADAHWNRALLCLSRGDFARGLSGYEWRWKRGIESPRDFWQPLWNGDDLAGKTILLHAEQGFGDTIQMLRYLPLVAGKGGKIVLEIPDGLMPLIDNPDIALVHRGGTLPDFDVHCPLMSLPLAFGTTLATIPATVPYLHAPAGRLEKWQARLGAIPAPRIGLVWSGKTSHTNDHNRSIALAKLAPLLSRPDFSFVSLQRDYREEDGAELARWPKLTRLDGALGDFGDTAAVMAELDLIIAVDTAVAHLAGALGRPVWLLIPHMQDWRWFTGRTDSPWYPSARLFRQTTPGDWDSVIAALAEALADFKGARPVGAG